MVGNRQKLKGKSKITFFVKVFLIEIISLVSSFVLPAGNKMLAGFITILPTIKQKR